MKIAILFSGQLGKFDYGQNKISNLWSKFVESNDVDVFCVTDDNNYYFSELDSQIFSISNSEKNITNGNLERKYNKTINLPYDESVKNITKLLKNAFGLKLKNFEILNDELITENTLVKNKNHIDFFYKSNRDTYHKIGLINQFFKLKKCFDLVEEYENSNNFKYDIIVRTRFDTYIDMQNIKNLDYTNTIYAPYMVATTHINDWCAIGNRYIMSIYCNYYNNFSQNLQDNYYHFLKCTNGHWYTTKIGFNVEEENPELEISDSSETGLTYILNILEKYNISTDINFIGPDKFYY